jgi:hypothetical protein
LHPPGGLVGFQLVQQLHLGGHGGAHVVDDQHPRPVHQGPGDEVGPLAAGLAVGLGLLAVVVKADLDAVLAPQGDGHGLGQGAALVGRPQDHVHLVPEPGVHEPGREAAPQLQGEPAGAEHAQVEEIGGGAAVL